MHDWLPEHGLISCFFFLSESLPEHGETDQEEWRQSVQNLANFLAQKIAENGRQENHTSVSSSEAGNAHCYSN